MSAAAQGRALGLVLSKFATGDGFSAWGLIGGKNPCNAMYEDAGDYWIYGDTSSRNIPYVVCYKNDTDLIGFNQPEVELLECLTDLHYKQGDSCITDDACTNKVKGGYHGHIESLRIPSAFENGDNNDDLKINGDQSVSFQEAWRSLAQKAKGGVRGTQIHDHPPGPYVFLAKLEKNGDQTDAHQKISDWSLPGMQVNWQGNDLADC
ncbi:hypothetical protein F4821DRAFT_47266 [Hypoxylon rubiginosum]|uniref:Uncharacterized protein n=1 Tax=Hypoxylon rubiginosum TaxID=110542 RepID=A0ACC0CKH2_9PEZI|nr:hypothetical protein F4821DRAFT_47266 [Hypoxylon rubiginosum]